MEKPPSCVYWHLSLCGVVIGCTHSTCKRPSEIGSGVRTDERPAIGDGLTERKDDWGVCLILLMVISFDYG